MCSKWLQPLLSLRRLMTNLPANPNARRIVSIQHRHCSVSLNGFSSIFALSSGYGKCGVSIIRVSGPHASTVLCKMARFHEAPEPRKAYVRKIYHSVSEEVLDKPVLLWFPGPNSFTGEDCCEFQVHGGPAVIQAVLDSLQNMEGLRHAEPGEFTKRAFINHKLDLTEVEGLGDLIHAETEQQRRQAVRQMDGHLSKLYGQWREVITKCVANVEAFIDFSEDDNIEADVLVHVSEMVEDLKSSIHHHLSDHRRGERLRDGVNICILGLPNVGKSSLLNKICQRPAAIVSPIAGTTRDIVESMLNIGGYPVIVGDTAGLRHTHDLVEKEGVRRAIERTENADLRILVVDSTDFSSEETKLHAFVKTHLKQLGLGENSSKAMDCEELMKDMVVVFNKNDLCDITGEDYFEIILEEDDPELSVAHISCVTEAGIDDFMEILKSKVAGLCADPTSGSPSLTQARHRHHLEKCLRALDMYSDFVDTDIVLAAHELREAMRQIGKITGKISSEDILDVIFKDFCIGK